MPSEDHIDALEEMQDTVAYYDATHDSHFNSLVS